MAREMSDAQLKAVLYRIAHTYLEVERGLRPPEHLQPFLTPHEYRRHRSAPRPDRPRLGPVQIRDMGRVQVERPSDDKISASVLTRRGDELWGALLIHLRDRGDGWQVDHLERLGHAIELAQRAAPESPNLEEALDRRISTAESERSLVEAARNATATRIDDIGDRRTKASRALSQQLDSWEGYLADLDRELDTLRRARALRGARETEVRAVAHTTRNSTCDLEDVLGPRPDQTQSARSWDRIAKAIRDYRERWQLTEDERPLGGPAANGEHATERRKLIAQVHDYRERQSLHEEKKGPRSPRVGRETSLDLDLGPDL